MDYNHYILHPLPPPPFTLSPSCTLFTLSPLPQFTLPQLPVFNPRLFYGGNMGRGGGGNGGRLHPCQFTPPVYPLLAYPPPLYPLLVLPPVQPLSVPPNRLPPASLPQLPFAPPPLIVEHGGRDYLLVDFGEEVNDCHLPVYRPLFNWGT